MSTNIIKRPRMMRAIAPAPTPSTVSPPRVIMVSSPVVSPLTVSSDDDTI